MRTPYVAAETGSANTGSQHGQLTRAANTVLWRLAGAAWCGQENLLTEHRFEFAEYTVPNYTGG